jgi:5'-nucleotidase
MIVPASVRGLTFGPEAEAANEAARRLREQGVRAIVVLIHHGGTAASADINGCDRLSSDFVDLVRRMSDDIDVVVSGHTHRAYNCTIGTKLVTSASSTGRVITDIDLRLERAGGGIISKSARNLVVTRDVEKHQATTALIASYRPVADAIGGRVVGRLETSLRRAPNEAGESPLGDVIADAMLEGATAAPGGAAVAAFTNPGGIRADIVRTAGAGPAPVTYAQLFDVQPFGNIVLVKTLTGEAIVDVLEQQFGPASARILQVSRGFTYAYDSTRPRGQRIDRESVRIGGMPLVLAQRYRVATNDFLWTSGDGFTALGSGTDPVAVGVDVDLLADYFSRKSPVAPGPQNRIRRIR